MHTNRVKGFWTKNLFVFEWDVELYGNVGTINKEKLWGPPFPNEIMIKEVDGSCVLRQSNNKLSLHKYVKIIYSRGSSSSNNNNKSNPMLFIFTLFYFFSLFQLKKLWKKMKDTKQIKRELRVSQKWTSRMLATFSLISIDSNVIVYLETCGWQSSSLVRSKVNERSEKIIRSHQLN